MRNTINVTSTVYSLVVPYSINKSLTWSWYWSLGSQPTGDLVIKPVIGCHYLMPGPQLLIHPKCISTRWPVPNYTACWQRHTDLSSSPKTTTQCCPARSQTCVSQVQCLTNSTTLQMRRKTKTSSVLFIDGNNDEVFREQVDMFGPALDLRVTPLLQTDAHTNRQ